jgi:hypothetical protein
MLAIPNSRAQTPARLYGTSDEAGVRPLFHALDSGPIGFPSRIET